MNQHSEQYNQPERERALFLYTSALERGDFDTVAEVLHQAEQDAQLERMILEVNEVYWVEEAVQVQSDVAVLVQQLVAEHLPSGRIAEEEFPPLTAGQVASRMEAEGNVVSTVRQELSAVASRLRAAETPLPDDLSRRGVARFFSDIGVSASQQLQKLFRETALLLSLGQQQGQSLAAARRQHPQNQQDDPPSTDEVDNRA